jgi:hypothetical protein
MIPSGCVTSMDKMVTIVFFIAATGVAGAGAEEEATVSRTHNYKSLTGYILDNKTNGTIMDMILVICDVSLCCVELQIIQ